MSDERTDFDFSPIVEELCAQSRALTRAGALSRGARLLPSRRVLYEVVDGLRGVLFPRYFGESKLSDEALRFHVGATMDQLLPILEEQVERCLVFVGDDSAEQRAECRVRAQDVVRELFGRLPAAKPVL